jgi:hypothetical protein
MNNFFSFRAKLGLDLKRCGLLLFYLNGDFTQRKNEPVFLLSCLPVFRTRGKVAWFARRSPMAEKVFP